MNLFIACPRHGDVRGKFAECLANMMARTGPVVTLAMPNSTNLCESRAKLVRHAQERGASHILWLDTDMAFPPDLVWRLLVHDLPIVGINYSRKSAARRPTAYKLDHSGPAQTTKASTGVEEVSHCGFGALLMKLSVFDSIKRPWFVFQPLAPEYERTMGEDVYMCAKLRGAGQSIYIDHDLSKECAHIGEFDYTLEG